MADAVSKQTAVTAEAHERWRMSMYLTCSHCGCEFLATEGQAKRAAQHPGKHYCSKLCQNVGQGQSRWEGKRKVRYPGTCGTCGTVFQSVYPGRKYCSLRCYMKNPVTQQRLRELAVRANAAAVLKNTGQHVKPAVEVTCLNCGVKRLVRPSLEQRRFCNSRCYRQYMAQRFDRWIAAPQSIALPQGYDEFLTQNELPCLIEDCHWVGLNLGNHVNFAHGITAADFKRAAGFNLGTGLCTPAISEKLSDAHQGLAQYFGGKVGNRGGNLVPSIRHYASLEQREHSEKARALICLSPEATPVKTCEACGKEFQARPMGHGAKFCTIACRDEWYQKNQRALRFWLPCGWCGKDFQGTRSQQLRLERGHQVFCTFSCRGLAVWQLESMRNRRPPRRKEKE